MTPKTSSPPPFPDADSPVVAPVEFKPASNELLLHHYAERAYLDYAVAVVTDRALGRVEDGNKPVHRRILFAMKNLGLTPDTKPVKSARIVGEILGKWHPHGDSSVYDAFVRLSQPFNMRYPLITGQGNFGSRDGDSSAAMRYCFPSGTSIAINENHSVPIEQIVSPEDRKAAEAAGPGTAIVINQTVETSKGTGQAVRWVYSGVHDVLEVSATHGQSVRCTPNEPFLVLASDLELYWKRADELVPGERVCMRREYVTGTALGTAQDTVPFVHEYLANIEGTPAMPEAPANDLQASPAVKSALANLSRKVPTVAAKMQEVVDRNYFYAEIKSVLPSGREAVYDLTVEGTHAFVANGFVVHNTEARLSPISSLLLDELGASTVDHKPNYDGSLLEPTLLPARLPMLLLNGTMGIAVGMASNLPPHNLREVVNAALAVLANPQITTEELLTLLPGPDFPDGGQLISSPSEIQQAYETGRGSLRVRARWTREDLARNQWQIAINELPYQVSTKMILQEIETLSNPQIPAGKKALSQQQVNLKTLALDFLENARDESGKDASIRIVLVPRNGKVDQEALMNFLLANTSLEATFGLNATMIGADSNPATKGLVQILREWCEFRTETVRRRTRHELTQTEKRIHVLEGRLVVFLNVEAVIKVIREAEDPRADLMAKFGLSEVQADDILEMRLRALNKLEGFKLEKELEALQKEAKRLRALLASSAAMKKLVSMEIEEAGAKYGDPRRTLIKPEVRASGAAVAAKAVSDEPLTIIVSKHLWVRAKAGHGLEKESFDYKPSDSEGFVLEARSTGSVVFMDSLGRVYSVQASEIPAGRGDGAPLTTLIDIQAGGKIVWAQSGDLEQTYLFAGKKGYGFTARLGQCLASKRAGKAFLTLEAGELPMAPLALSGGAAGSSGLVATASSDGRLLVFPAAEVKALPNGGKGVMLLLLETGQELTALRELDKPGIAGELEVLVKGQPERMAFSIEGADWPKYEGHRARKGCQLPKKGVLRD